jgi:hypothetical protein
MRPKYDYFLYVSIAIQIHQHQTYGNVGKIQNKILSTPQQTKID